jgi:NAD(P)-dependent dehydrogenase (short-subunit alcohol dehydrogenase family)
LQLVRSYAARPNHTIFAACRSPDKATELKQIRPASDSNVRIVALDVTSDESIRQAVEHIRTLTPSLNVLINNAGINTPPNDPILKTPREWMTSCYDTNVSGALAVTQSCDDLLRASAPRTPLIVNMSSTLASIANCDGGSVSYRCSKAALNMLTSVMAVEMKDAIVIAQSPGWVATDMGSAAGAAPLSPETSVTGMLMVWDKATQKESGTFIEYNGSTLPW